ncbi:MAG TPA: polyprenyl synthetase family protein [Actinomycetota bacterium]|nr:polyprenyl synthetase family protein [Actinomycetota bacterium]
MTAPCAHLRDCAVTATPVGIDSDLRTRVDVGLLEFLRDQRDDLPADARPLVDELERLVTAGGKRLRPVFCYWGHIAAGGADGEPILQVAGALELLHTFAIVHDDVVDRSPLRRGGPAAHESLSADGGGWFGVSAAVLAGDLAMVLADSLMSRAGFPPEAMGRARQMYDRMRVRAIAGEFLDLRASRDGFADEQQARRIARLKSGGYTVADPLAIGAALATDDPDVQRVLSAYGLPLGEAFQIRDDILGVFGDPSVTGKDRDGDLREGKQTVLVAMARRLDPRASAVLNAHLGRRDLDTQDAARVREAILESGALAAASDLISRLAGDAVSAIDADVIGAHAASALEDLAARVAVRED